MHLRAQQLNRPNSYQHQASTTLLEYFAALQSPSDAVCNSTLRKAEEPGQISHDLVHATTFVSTSAPAKLLRDLKGARHEQHRDT